LTVWVYPVVVHWCWSNTGWLSPFNEDTTFDTGVIDFAGSGVVHMVGGWSGLLGAYFLGPRHMRFAPTTTPADLERTVHAARQFKLGHNVSMEAMGTLILWFGWFGFNCGSTLAAAGAMELASKVAVNTTLAAASGGIIVACLEKYVAGDWVVPAICNGVLAALVSITAPCAVVKPVTSILIGCIGGALCWAASKLLEKLEIDDPLDAFPVHGVCGAWGVISVGIFAFDDDDIAFAGYSTDVSQGYRLGIQMLAVFMIALWCIANGLIIFGGMAYFKVLRVDQETEEDGLDFKEHGGIGYSTDMMFSKEQKERMRAKYIKKVTESMGASQDGVAAGSATNGVEAETGAAPAETNGVEVEMGKK